MSIALLEKPTIPSVAKPVQRFALGQTVYAVWEDPEEKISSKDAGIVIGIIFVWASSNEELKELSHLELGYSYVCRSVDPGWGWVDTFHDSMLVAE